MATQHPLMTSAQRDESIRAQDNFFAIIGVVDGASKEDITAEYRRRARECHPDKHPHDLQKAEEFQELQRAYEILTKPTLRSQYDKYRTTGLQIGFAEWLGSSDTGATVHWKVAKGENQRRAICTGQEKGEHNASIAPTQRMVRVPRIFNDSEHLAWLLDEN